MVAGRVWTLTVVPVLHVASDEIQFPSKEDCHSTESFMLKRLDPPHGMSPQVRGMHVPAGYFETS